MSKPFLILAAALLVCGVCAAFQQTPPAASAAPPSATPTPPPAAATPPTGSATPPSGAPSGAPYKIPPEAVNLPNPVHPTPQSLARAKQIYGFDCAMCHGADGSGKGDLTADTKLKDYRDPATLKGFTDGELFYIIQNGKGDSMPGEGPRATPVETWNLVIYLRSFSKGQAATASAGPA